MASQLFLNLPVQDLQRSVAFFTALGFTFNPDFTDENATCMVVNENAYVMLLVEAYFKTFTTKEVASTKGSAEAIIAYSVDSREAVDQAVQNALANGGSASQDAQDYGFMYNHSFQDPDGHLWEVLWMDPAGPPAESPSHEDSAGPQT
ncbi:VOC family protein [Pseudarthrobacter polychromogenes]|uniref:Extradiol dioxygenase n=1 Tax=Pseudarthrobacter polychromogenes TaxID=1676 RepID=A0ABQ1XZZ8_9MICC|nr:VOC family protein [Pseudarthrobacter polychromogenes]MBD1593869.1 VOC family protein [Arthrobacter sp. S1_S22]GGH08172.1 extradiol dioxygenase [Pseudarthrobacter polychromogenes]